MSLIPLTFYLTKENGDINSHQLSFKARCMDAVLLNAPYGTFLGSFDRSAVSLSNLKIILIFCRQQ